MKHIMLYFHFVHEHVKGKELHVVHIPNKLQPEDVLIKAFRATPFIAFQNKLTKDFRWVWGSVLAISDEQI